MQLRRKTRGTRVAGGGKSKSSQCSPAASPSFMASPSVSDRDVPNAEDNTLNEASCRETHEVLDMVDCFRKDTCIRCDESGDLLVCAEIGCPIALHEFCMSCEPSIDEEGRFYCPYCAYKRALARVNELRRKAMVAKSTLSDFIDRRMVGGGNSQQVGEAGKKKASDVSIRDHESHLGNESLRDQDMLVEQNQSNKEENPERTAGDVQPTSMVRINGENHDGPIVPNVSNGIRSTPEVLLCEDSINEDESHEADTSRTHQVDSLEDKEDGKTMEEENLRSTDVIQDEGIVKDHGQPETPSAYHDGEETTVDDGDHGAVDEPQDKGDGGEQIQPEKEGMREDIDLVMMEEENLRSTDDIQDEEIVKDHSQLKTPSAHPDGEEITVDDGNHGAEDEPQNKGDGGEQIQPEKEGMLEDIDLVMMEEENLRSTDDIQDEEIVKDHSQLKTPSAHPDGEEIIVDDGDHGAEDEPQNKGDGGEQIQPEKEGMLEDIDLVSGNNDLKNETIAKKKRFKTKANRRVELRNFNSPRKSLRLQTPNPGKKSPHIQTPKPGIKIEKVSTSRSLKLQPASPNQFKTFDSHGGKRKRMRWSTEEEEMLKEGVQKFSSMANKNLPWRKILEFGRHIFDDTRTPVDLKDKWRNIQAK